MNDGWGLVIDGKILFGSDGSLILYKIDLYNMKGIFFKVDYFILIFKFSVCYY